MEPRITKAPQYHPQKAYLEEIDRLKEITLEAFHEIQTNKVMVDVIQTRQIKEIEQKLVSLEKHVLSRENMIGMWKLTREGVLVLSNVRFVWKIVIFVYPIAVTLLGIVIEKGLFPLHSLMNTFSWVQSMFRW